jgi:hypothetical protein
VTAVAVAVALVLCTGGVASAQSGGRPAAAPPPDGAGATPQAAPTDKRRVVGVLEVRVDGVPDDVKESFQRGLESQLDDQHYYLRGRAQMKQFLMRSTKWTEGCLIGQCLSEVRVQTGADLVLLAAFTGSGTSFGYVVTLVRTDTGRVLQQESDRCDVCTVNEAIDKATRATRELLGRLPETLPDESAEAAQAEAAITRAKEQLAEQRLRVSRLGLGLALVGVGVLVTGAGLYAFDAKGYAAMTAAGGAAMAASGVVVLTF